MIDKILEAIDELRFVIVERKESMCVKDSVIDKDRSSFEQLQNTYDAAPSQTIRSRVSIEIESQYALARRESFGLGERKLPTKDSASNTPTPTMALLAEHCSIISSQRPGTSPGYPSYYLTSKTRRQHSYNVKDLAIEPTHFATNEEGSIFVSNGQSTGEGMEAKSIGHTRRISSATQFFQGRATAL